MVGVLATAIGLMGLVETAGTSSAAGGGYDFHRTERCFLRKINRARERHGMSKLDWDKQLGYVARKHARVMAGSGTIWHDAHLGTKVTRWRRIGDNVGKGPGCPRLFKAFMRSSGHRRNILGRWRFVGAGVNRNGNTVFVDTIFESRRNPNNVYSYP